MSSNTSPLAIAIGYLERGWSPVESGHRRKKPSRDDWQSDLTTADNITTRFNGHAQNIGIVLGRASNGLTDIDLDCPEALAMADDFLLLTNAKFGRRSTPAAHALYYQNDLEIVRRLRDPVANKTGYKATLIEFRSGGDKGAQTIFPGSTHEDTDEPIEWTPGFDGEPATVDGIELFKRTRGLASACLLARYWPEGARHDAVMAFAGGMARAGKRQELTELIIRSVCRCAGDNEVADRMHAIRDTYMAFRKGEECTGWPTLAEILPEKVVSKITEWLDAESAPSSKSSIPEPSASHLASFDIGNMGDMSCYLDTVDRKLAEQNPPIVYQRAGALCKVVERDSEVVQGVSYQGRHTRIVTFSAGSQVQDKLTRHFSWTKQVKRGVYTYHAAPALAAQAYMRRQDWALPELRALANTPTIRPDGTVNQISGYDADTGIYVYIPPGIPTVSENPTHEDALKALEFIKTPFAEFPYTSEAGRSVALAAVITSLLRPSLRSAPACAFSAAKMGEGKSLQADCVSMIATGGSPAMMTRTDDADEFWKRSTSILMHGSTVVVIDNVNGTIESELLCSLLTEPFYSDRVLGSNRIAELPTNVTWMLTGNHVRVAGDLTTRTLLSELDSGEEHPEYRTGFKLNLREWIPANRGQLIHAALTIVRAYCSAGCPDIGVSPWGRFEDWSQMVRNPLIWLGCADPVETVSEVQGDDPRREELRELLAAWYAVYGADGKTANEVSKDCHPGIAFGSGDPKEVLRDLVCEMFSDGGKVNARRLGRYLGQQANRIEGGYCFRKTRGHNNTIVWNVKVSRG